MKVSSGLTAVLVALTVGGFCVAADEAPKTPAIQLQKPANGTTTAPLQMVKWPAAAGQAPAADAEDKFLPRPVSFAWQAPAESKIVAYDLVLSPNADLTKALIRKDLQEPSCDVAGLYVGTDYYWKVSGKTSDGQAPAESKVWKFKTNDAPPRWIKVPGVTNLRDIGGWTLPDNKRIRQGLVYRSSDFDNLRSAGKQVLLDDVKIRTELDLRNPGEDTKKAFDQPEVKYMNIQLGAYDDIADAAQQPNWRKVFQVLADPANYPIVFHDSGGIHRSGTVAILLEGLLGASQDEVRCDYELSTFTKLDDANPESKDIKDLMGALSRLGGDKPDLQSQVEGYLLSIGVTADQIAAIRKQMIEELPAKPQEGSKPPEGTSGSSAK